MMSSFFIWFPISDLGEPKIYHHWADFTRFGQILYGCLTVKNHTGANTGDDEGGRLLRVDDFSEPA